MDGQNININLAAGLDSSTSDMLVPVNKPTFQHNWQKFQGQCIPNSLRYEQNGWAAGWNVYDFAYNAARINVGDFFVGRTKLNDNPTYILGIYDKEDSTTPLETIPYTDVTKIISGNGILSGNTLHSSLESVDFDIIWDEETVSAALVGPVNLELFTNINNDYTVTFTVKDIEKSYKYDFNFFTPDKLTGDDLINPVNWTSLSDNVQHWGDEFSYNSATNVFSAPGADPVFPVITDDNKITFDFTQNIDEQIKFVLTLKEYVLKYENIKFSAKDGLNEKGLLSLNASELTPLDKLKVDFSSTQLYPGDNGLIVEQKVPVYLTAAVKFDENKPDISSFIKKPENVHPSQFQIMFESVNQKVKICSVFDITHEYEDIYSYTGDYVGINLHGNRYNYLKISNGIGPGSKWQPYRYKPTTRYYPYATSAFEAFSTATQRKAAQDVLGKLYTLRYNYFNMASYLKVNNIWDRTDATSAFYKRDVSGYRSICAVDAEPTADFQDDLEYTFDHMPADDFMLKHVYTRNTQNISDNPLEPEYVQIEPDVYNPSQASQSYTDLYSASGKYIGNTYEHVPVVLTYDSTFWPFEWVPCFNFDGQKCYWTDGIKTITDLEEFKDFVLGTYDEEKLVLPVTLQEDYSRTRAVYKYVVHWDFDKLGFTKAEDVLVAQELSGWEEIWKRWYPSYQDPKNWDIEPDYDDTYTDFDDIEIFEDAKLPVRVSHPGALASCYRSEHSVNILNIAEEMTRINYFKDRDDWPDSIFVFTPNVFDIYPLTRRPNITTDLSKAKFNVWHNHVDVTDKYELVGAHEWDETYTDEYGNPQMATHVSPGCGYLQGVACLAYDTANSGGFNDCGVYLPLYITPNIYLADEAGYQMLQGNYQEAVLQMMPVVGYRSYNFDEFPHYDIDLNLCFLFNHLDPEANVAFKEKVDNTGWVHLFGTSWKERIDTDVPPYYTYRTVSPSNNVPTIGNTFKSAGVGNWDSIVCIPFEGRVASEVKYTEITTKQELEQDTSGKYFSFTKAPDSRLNDRKLYIDRETINQYSYNWATQRKVDLAPITLGETSASFEIAIDMINDACLFIHKNNKDVANQSVELFDYYAPGVAFGSKSSETGNMTPIEGTSSAHINMRDTYKQLPEAMSASFKEEHSTCQHRLYKDVMAAFGNISCEIVSYDFEAGLVNVSVSCDAFELPLVYDLEIEKLCGALGTFDVAGVPVTVHEVTGNLDLEYLPITVKLEYKNNTSRVMLVDSGFIVTFADELGNTIIDDKLQYNYISQNSADSDRCDVSVVSGNKQKVYIEKDTKVEITCVMPGAFGAIKSGNIISYNDLSIDISKFNELEDIINVHSTDIRDPDTTKLIGKLKSDSEFQLVKQQWNSTVEVENFWWVDDTHILELNTRFLTLKHNTDKLHDWDGNIWEEIWNVPRSNYITQFTRVYFVTNVYGNEKALLVCLSVSDTTTVTCDIYEILPELKLRNTVYFTCNNRDLGTRLNNKLPDANRAYLSSYNKLTANQLLVQAKWSNTIRDGRLIIGCHLSKNYDQWSIVFNLNTSRFEKVIQGYGFVGLKGDLTGGQLPRYCFDASIGFNGTVEPVNKLLDADGNGEIDTTDIDKNHLADPKNINKVNEIIVGSAEQQWYIRKVVSGIVSHLCYQSDGKFSVEELPITNKYDSVYGSPSFMQVIIGDLMVQPHAISDLFKVPNSMQKVWNVLMGLCGWPSIWFFSPRLSRLVYLQQTIGQYAYVHYNTLETRPEEFLENGIDEQERQINTDANKEKVVKKTTNPLHDISMSFDKQVFEQSTNIEMSTHNFAIGLHFLFLSAMHNDKIHDFVNSTLNQTLTTEESAMQAQFALDNIAYISEKALSTEGIDFACKSVVVGIKTLDMFYSTSDQQEIWAGPGFVEHQFVADCVAQSSVDVNTEGQVLQTTWLLANLTTFILEKEAEIELMAAEWLSTHAESVSNFEVCATSIGTALAETLILSGEVMAKTAQLQKTAAANLKDMLGPLADHISSGSTNELFRRDLSVEGAHKYGQKNEHFMWPCWGVPSERLDYTDETVTAALQRSAFKLNLPAAKFYTNGILYDQTYLKVQQKVIGSYQQGQDDVKHNGAGNVNYLQATCIGSSTMRKLPADMAKIEGVSCFLPTSSFKNKNVGMPGPTFAPSVIQDYIIDKDWQISICGSFGERPWVACKDTKLINCEPSNMVVKPNFCGIASPYTAIEVKRGLTKQYMRPWAITPNTLAFNCTGYNCILDDKMYHAFDGYSYRVVDLVGAPGMDKNLRSRLYAFQENDRFKRSNIPPANTLLGNFKGEGVQFVQSIDPFWTEMNVAFKKRGLVTGTASEDRDNTRWAIPIFTEQISTLPAVVKTLAAYPLAVADGVTCLCTKQITDTNAKYKAPISVDFSINKHTYRATEEYICEIQNTELMSTVTDILPSLGLVYIGATPFEAFFYSKATRCYYSFQGNALRKVNMLERFRDIQKGYWDFVNQEVVMPCLMTYKRLNKEVEDKDTETDNIIVPLLKDSSVSGELPPPLTTIFNDRSWYKCVSLPSGFAYQGPNRVIINRAVFVEYMLKSMKRNLNKWAKLPRERYSFRRKYPEVYTEVDKDVQGIKGWTYNPFVLVTSALGLDDSTDCMYEWEITFCWPIEMDLLYGTDNFAVVNISAETMTPGGKQLTRPTHVFLTKELFTRTGNYGYYSFRYQSKNGAGNRERLHIWSDQYIAISKLSVAVKSVTQRRTEQLTQQLDVQNLKEL